MLKAGSGMNVTLLRLKIFGSGGIHSLAGGGRGAKKEVAFLKSIETQPWTWGTPHEELNTVN